MVNSSNYASALRCIGQSLRGHDIEAFELKIHANQFRLLAGDPNPPCTALIELNFSLQNIESLDRQGKTRRGQADSAARFDSVPEVLRAVGEYVDRKNGSLRRVDNSASPESAVEIEYQDRAGDVKIENLTASLIRDICVRMYKRRTRLAQPINILTRKR
jgi:hypothetical protein